MMNKNKFSGSRIFLYTFLILIVAGAIILFKMSGKQGITKYSGSHSVSSPSTPLTATENRCFPILSINKRILEIDTSVEKADFYKRNPSVKMIAITNTVKNDTAIFITLKNRKYETYFRSNPDDVKQFVSKYGKLPPLKLSAYTFVEQMPKFPGGRDTLMQYLKEHLKYPEEAKGKNIRGVVVVKFVVQKNGSLTNIRTIGRKKGYGLEEEALRVVKAMPKWIPGKQEGKVVPVEFSLAVRFSS